MNRLRDQTSPYLRQHAANPVDWYPWGPEAFEAARRRDVPILLSVGYSACHWCHVMAHESFEDPEVAQVANEGFVAVKVDREERPDVDALYMEAVQALTGSGGWPMTVLLTPDGRPFHGGTYYPRQTFVELLAQVSQLWRERRDDLERAADTLSEAVRRGVGVPAPAPGLEPQPIRAGAELVALTTDSLLAMADPEWGGFGRAPKFPQTPMLELLLLSAQRLGRPDAARAARLALDAMAAGGIYDHLGGGFARYSTDRMWLVPHFEKMLYDNALLARTYLHAWQSFGEPAYEQVTRETLAYLLRPPMAIAGAGFASAEDADSEGEEGRFYLWSYSELLEVAGKEAAAWYQASPEGNFEGRNILHRPLGAPLGRPPGVEAARKALFSRREDRVRPSLDDKVLTEWNAMAVATLAEAGFALGEQMWLDEASRVGDFLWSELRRPDGRWLRSWQAGKARHLAFAADYGWLVEAYTRLAEATGQARWLERALSVATEMTRLFFDPQAGAFATTGQDAEALLARPVDTQDGAIPSANSVAAMALLRLAALMGDQGLADPARAVIASFSQALRAAPRAFCALVKAAVFSEEGLAEVVVSGDRPDLLCEYRRRFLPGAVLAWGEPFDSPVWEGRLEQGAAGRGYVCRGYACDAPCGDSQNFGEALERLGRPSTPPGLGRASM